MKRKTVLVIAFIVSLVMLLSTSVGALLPYTYRHSAIEEYVYENIDSSDIWYYDEREFVLKEALMLRKEVKEEPFSNTPGFIHFYCDFLGDDEVTRSYASALLHRYDGNDITVQTAWGHLLKDDEYDFNSFADIPSRSWYIPAAQWAYDNGIVNGVGGAYFAPDRTITREEFAAMLYRYTNYLEVDTSARADFSGFADADSVSSWATDSMSWAVAEGLISGKPGDLLAPQDTITRAEVAVIIYRFNNEVKAHRDIWNGGWSENLPLQQ